MKTKSPIEKDHEYVRSTADRGEEGGACADLACDKPATVRVGARFYCPKCAEDMSAFLKSLG